MIGSNEQNVTSSLASVVNGLDGLVGGSDGLNGSVVDSGVTDLWEKKENERTRKAGRSVFVSFRFVSSRRFASIRFD